MFAECEVGGPEGPLFLLENAIMLEKISTLLGVLAMVFAGYFYIENNFARAVDLAKMDAAVQQQIQTIRKEQIEDKVFELEFKQNSGRLTPLEQAMLERQRRKLQELNKR